MATADGERIAGRRSFLLVTAIGGFSSTKFSPSLVHTETISLFQYGYRCKLHYRVSSACARWSVLVGERRPRGLPPWFGLACFLEVHSRNDIEAERLVTVLDDWSPPFSGDHLSYLSRRQLSLAFTALLDALHYREPHKCL